MLDIELDSSDVSASREFAEFYFDGDKLKVRNLSKKMSIIINDSERIDPGQNSEETTSDVNVAMSSTGTVLPGDVVHLGKHELKVDYKLPEPTSSIVDPPTEGNMMDYATVADMTTDGKTEGNINGKTFNPENTDGYSDSQYTDLRQIGA